MMYLARRVRPDEISDVPFYSKRERDEFLLTHEGSTYSARDVHVYHTALEAQIAILERETVHLPETAVGRQQLAVLKKQLEDRHAEDAAEWAAAFDKIDFGGFV